MTLDKLSHFVNVPLLNVSDNLRIPTDEERLQIEKVYAGDREIFDAVSAML